MHVADVLEESPTRPHRTVDEPPGGRRVSGRRAPPRCHRRARRHSGTRPLPPGSSGGSAAPSTVRSGSSGARNCQARTPTGLNV
eukprot:2360350-Amphidinium_carterae.3